MRAWGELLENRDYVIVARDDLPDGGYLSTVWFGLDRAFFGRPLIFETARFNAAEDRRLEFPDIFADGEETTNELRYSSEEEALAAHHEIVRRIRLKEGH